MPQDPYRAESPLEKFQNELKALFNRWGEESDISDEAMAMAALDATERYFDKTVDFEADFPLDD